MEMSATSEELRGRVAEAFARWHDALKQAFATMQSRGLLSVDARPDELAHTRLAAIQGGYLLSTAEQDVLPMVRALELAFTRLRSLAHAPAR
ncbi:MAG: hypothetical protein DLM61_04465 [Pseudonocardiales bacterium]|nr:MAG: hypothetical protein DLM61_04465 [Pseudonocardiales bacterium]